MKSAQIISEELKAAGLPLAEEVVQQIVDVATKKIIPRLAAEADESAVKAVAGVALLALPALEPAIEKLEDFNKDGHVGVKA